MLFGCKGTATTCKQLFIASRTFKPRIDQYYSDLIVRSAMDIRALDCMPVCFRLFNLHVSRGTCLSDEFARLIGFLGVVIVSGTLFFGVADNWLRGRKAFSMFDGALAAFAARCSVVCPPKRQLSRLHSSWPESARG